MQPRSDYLLVAHAARDPRPIEQIAEHYQLEKRLAARLKMTSRAERAQVYREVYDELFSSLPHHPQHNKNFSGTDYITYQSSVLKKLAKVGDDFIEIGAGDARLSVEMASHCRTVRAVDITDALFDRRAAPANVSFLLTTGVAIDAADESADFVYSNQLMEHLHPEDADDQLREIIRVLKPGGRYFCITPNITTGPHDVSKYYDEVAVGFHLKEYSFRSLADTMRRAGFRDVMPLLVRKGGYRKIPFPIARALEIGFRAAQAATGRSLRSNPRIRNLLGINMLALK